MTLLVAADRVQETALSIGATSPITLLGAADVGLQRFPASLDGQVVPYAIEHETTGQWEVGSGVFTYATHAVQRTTVYSNSLGTTALVNFAAGIVNVWVDAPSEKVPLFDATSSHLTLPAGLSITGALDGVTTLHSSGVTTLDSANVSIGGQAYVFPGSQSVGTFLKTDGSGNLTWAAVNQTLAGLTDVALAGPVSTQFLQYNGTKWTNHTLAASDVGSGAALTKADDTNVTLTLGGTPAAALLAASSLTLGWTGTLAAGRLNANVVQAITNDTNVTGSIAAQALTLGWSGQLSTTRGGTGLAAYVTGDLPYYNSGTALSRLAIGANYTVLTSSGSGPQWSTSLVLAGSLATTGVTFSQYLLSTTAAGTPGVISATEFVAFAGTNSGATLMGYGTTYDASLMNRAGTVALGVTSNTLDVVLGGKLTINGLAYTFPASQSANYFLQTDGSGNLSWVAEGASISLAGLSDVTITSATNGQALIYNSGTSKWNNSFVSLLTGLGTVTVGAWNATVVTTTYGGTGLASWTTGDVPYYNSGTALNKLNIGAANTVLTSSGTAPQWSTSLTLAGGATFATGVTVSLGGITVTGNSTITGTLGGITTLTATTVGGTLSTASQPNVTTMAGLTAASALATVGTITSGTWNASVVTTTYGGTGLASYTTGDLLYFNSGTAFNKLGIGAANTVAVSTGSAPSWSTSLNLAGAVTAGGLLTASASLAVTGGLTYTTTVTSTTNATTPSAFVGTQSTSFASTTLGNAQMGYGSTYDVSLLDRAGTVALGIGPNSTAVTIPGLINGQTISATANFTGSVSMGALTATGLLGVTVTSGYAATFMGGNVGIGTTNPLTTLQLGGNGATLRLDRSGGSANGAGDVQFYNGGTQQWNLTTLVTSYDFSLYNNGGSGAGWNFVVQKSTGNVGIGTTGPTHLLEVNGTFLAAGAVTLSSTLLVQSTVRFSTYGAGSATFDASGNITSVSDERRKQDISPFALGLAALRGIKPIVYRYGDDTGLDTENFYIGFGAQNVREFIPGAVFEHKQSGFLSLWERGIVAACVNAIQSLDDRLSRLEQRAA